MYIRPFLFCFFLFLFLPDCCWAQPTSAYVSGTVIDGVTKQPIEFSSVFLYTREAEQLKLLNTYQTDQTAQYHFDLDPRNQYQLLASAPEYFINRFTLPFFEAGDSLFHDIPIELEPIRIIEPIPFRLLFLGDPVYRFLQKDWSRSIDTVRDYFGGYVELYENLFIPSSQLSQTKVSVEADPMAYRLTRCLIERDQLPHPNNIYPSRLINHYSYNYDQPEGKHPIHLQSHVLPCPWNPDNSLLHIGMQTKKIDPLSSPPLNVVLLLDFTRSFYGENDIHLVKQVLRNIIQELRPQDRISILSLDYQIDLILPPTSGVDTSALFNLIDQIEIEQAGINLEAIQDAFDLIHSSGSPNTSNSVIFITEGGINPGYFWYADHYNWADSIAKQYSSGTRFSVFEITPEYPGDHRYDKLVQQGGGQYAIIERAEEAKLFIQRELTRSFSPKVKDVHLTIDFPSTVVKAYRLIGQEYRRLEGNRVDMPPSSVGQLYAGQSYTALYELIPQAIGPDVPPDPIDISLHYTPASQSSSEVLHHQVLFDSTDPIPADVFFAASVAEFGLLVRDHTHKGQANWDSIIRGAKKGLSYDPYGYKQEFVEWMRKAKKMWHNKEKKMK
ncbi:MAG: von Willebrand factor type A domain-containing protein [Bacteroidota bacterium]